MARSQLTTRWIKDKAKRKRTRPRTNKVYPSLTHQPKSTRPNNHPAGAISTGHNGTERRLQRLQEFISKNKPHHRILYMLLNPAFQDADQRLFQPDEFDHKEVRFDVQEGETDEEAVVRAQREFEEQAHPKILVELLYQRYIEQDPTLQVFEYNAVYLEKSDFHFVIMYFRGRECFLVYKNRDRVQRSITYQSTEYLRNLPRRKVTWEDPIFLDASSLEELSG